MGHYDCKSCGATPYEEHSADCEKFPSKPTDASNMTEADALDEAAKAAGWPNGWGEASRFAPNNLFNAIRAHAKTLMENAALKAENERLRGWLQHRGGPLCMARYYGDAKCNCGLTALIKEIEGD